MNVLDIATKNSFGMPRERLFNTIFHLRKINAKLMLNSYKTIFSHFFISLTTLCRKIFHFFCFYYAEMRRKLWPKAPAQEDALGQMSKKFQVYFIHISFFRKPDKKIYNRAKESYCAASMFVFRFFIVYLPKKKWKLKNNPRLSTLPYSNNCHTA